MYRAISLALDGSATATHHMDTLNRIFLNKKRVLSVVEYRCPYAELTATVHGKMEITPLSGWSGINRQVELVTPD